jgi:predicted aspartyl protease
MNKREGFMKRFIAFLVLLFGCLCTSSLYAEGTYCIIEGEGGIYMQTDEDGDWLIDQNDVKRFKVGESGTYYIRTDRGGTYIKTNKHGKFYIDQEVAERFEQKIWVFNREQERKTEQRETRIIIEGNQILVPVILGYRESETEALLLLDTGASMTALHRETADQLDIRETYKAEFIVMGGRSITGNVAKLSYVKVGPFTKQNIYAGIIEHEGPSVTHKGLLGMDFLRNLEYRVDFKKQVIEWKQ